MLRIERTGRCFVRGELVDDNPAIWIAFKDWIDGAVSPRVLAERLEVAQKRVRELEISTPQVLALVGERDELRERIDRAVAVLTHADSGPAASSQSRRPTT